MPPGLARPLLPFSLLEPHRGLRQLGWLARREDGSLEQIRLTFAHIGFVSTQPFGVLAALVMVAVGALAIAAALAAFRRRDLTGA